MAVGIRRGAAWWRDPGGARCGRDPGGPAGGGADIDRCRCIESRSLYWAGLNQGKRSVTIDTRTEVGQRRVAGLIAAPGEGGGIVLTNLRVKGGAHTQSCRSCGVT